MPFDGSGNFVRSFPPGGWQGDATGGIKILASRHDQHDNDIAAALSLVLTRDGQSMPTADINWNGKKIINLAAPIAGTDAANKAYVDGIRTFSTPIVISGSHPNAQLKFTGTTGPWGDSYVTADGAAGMRGATWVWNDKADFSGSDVMTLVKTGQLTLKGASYTGLIIDATTFGSFLQGKSASKVRWTMYLGDGGAESTGNAGSNFSLFAYADDGTTNLGAAMSIIRATRQVSFAANIPATSTTTGTVIVTGGLGVSHSIYTGGYIVSAGFITQKSAAGAAIVINKGASGNYAYLQGQVADKNRWVISLGDTAAESGANAGSDFGIYRYDDAGAYLGAPLTIDRATGSVSTQQSLVCGGIVYAVGGQFVSQATVLVLAASGGGSGIIYLRPQGNGSAAGQATISAVGDLTVSRNILLNGTIDGVTSILAGTFASAAPWTLGVNVYGASGTIYYSTNVASSQSPARFYNPNGLVGNITTVNSATQFNTSSDERLKEFNAEYDPQEAIAVIRADPVLGFTWKATGEEAIGWFAQKSYAVDENLASPPTPTAREDGTFAEVRMDAKPGDEDFVPWGIDYGRRTPYLWAALSNVLDRLEALEAKLSITDPKPPAKEAA